jgi:signal transduction histidine kinase
LWATLAFAFGTLLVFVVLHRFVADDIQRRSDAWLTGELGVLGDVAERTPKDRRYSLVLGEVAELASREVPERAFSTGKEDGDENAYVFFLQTDADGKAEIWVGAGDGQANLQAIRGRKLNLLAPSDLNVEGFPVPFRVASLGTADGGHIYLGLSEKDEMRVLRNLRIRFMLLGLLIVLFGFVIVFCATKQMLGSVRRISEAAARIDQSDLSSRVPTPTAHDEVGHLATTLNHMLDRIENSMRQLHAITDSLAHDLRSPLTAIRGKLETSLSAHARSEQAEPVVAAIDMLDRLTEFLNASLDVAEARADALRLNRTEIDMEELLKVMINLYEPSMLEKGLAIRLFSDGPVMVSADSSLIQRMIANLLDNELKHLPDSCSIAIRLAMEENNSVLTIEDNGPGFTAEVRRQMFRQRIKGKNSGGHGLGLAFIAAVVRAHDGSVVAENRPEGGVLWKITIPAIPPGLRTPTHSLALAAG